MSKSTPKNPNTLTSPGIYTGVIRHRRFKPCLHEFRYRFKMLFLDLDALDSSLNKFPVVGTVKWRLGSFLRKDYHGPSEIPLKQWILDNVERSEGYRPTGKIFVLTNLRLIGWLMNPIAMFYCYDADGQHVNTVLQVTNTPWREKILYVLGKTNQRQTNSTSPDSRSKNSCFWFRKNMHVSPFNPMNMHYLCRLRKPSSKLFFHLENHQNGERHTDATLTMDYQPATAQGIRNTVLAQPWLTLKVAAGIYWNALLLFLKRSPVYDHPDKNKTESPESSISADRVPR